MIEIVKSSKGRYCIIHGKLPENIEILLDELLSCSKKGAEYSPKFKQGLWDGKIHLLRQYPVKEQYYFPAGAITNVTTLLKLMKIPYTYSEETDVDIYPKMNFQWKSYKSLYDYQENILKEVFNHNGCGIVEMPTGSGKTLTALKYVQTLDLPFIVLVHRAELFDQWRTEIKEVLGEDPVMIGDTASATKIRAALKRSEKEILKVENAHAKSLGKKVPKLKDHVYEADSINIIKTAGEAREAIKNARCGICMVQTMHSFMKDFKSPLSRLEVPVVIVDECHTVPADTVFNVIYKSSCKYILGLSATVGRNDGLEMKISAAIGDRIESMNVEQLVERNVLAKPEFYMLFPDIPEEYMCHFSYYTKPNYQTAYTDCIVCNMKRNEMIAAAANQYMNNDHQIYIHVTKINHGEILQAMIPDSVMVFGNTPNRKQIIEDYRNGKIKCLISTLLKEGVSIPSIDVLIYAAGGKSEISTIQTIGRALRIKPDGRNAIIIDVYDAVETYMLEHTRDRIKTYEKVYGKLFQPKYIQ